MQSNKNIRHNQLLLQLLLWIFIFVTQVAPAQSHTPSASKDTLSFKALIDSLSRRYNLSFAYDALAISDDSLFCVDFSRAPDKRWIASLFENDSVEVSFIGSQVIIGRLQGAPSLPEVIKIYGLVKDAAINEALAMVNISLEGEPLGTSTNDAGAFEFKLPRSFQGRRIVFSSLGFANIYMEVPANDTLVDIGMKSLSIPLPEVQVMYRDPMKIMMEVRQKIHGNYSLERFLLTGFFRETIRQNGKYVDVSEAVVEIVKPPYNNALDAERVRFVKGRKGRELSEMDMVQFKLVGGPYHFSQLDVVRHGDFMPDENGLSGYRYSFNGMDIEFGQLVYCIGFKPYSDIEGINYVGEMRIDSESMALVSIDFQMTGQSVRRSRSHLIKRDARRFKTRPFYARYYVQYRPWDDIWVISKVRGEVSVRVFDRSERERSVFETVSEMIISDFSIADHRIRIPATESFRADYILSEHVGDFDPDFWKYYNVIKADEALETVFNKKE